MLLLSIRKNHLRPCTSSELILYTSSTSQTGLASGGALHEVSVVVAAMDFVVAVAEEAHMVSSAKRTRAPSRVDGPGGTTGDNSAVTAAASPTASARVCCSAALHITEVVPAAPHSRVSVAESANLVRLAK